ncbi:MAG TPA: NAD(P)/FAD-dependent oxidoreductase [Terrimesophilobacter sp.]|nr:NAD(P)/FAD-dependent oxidoreductase [Terrimesophilobacter sp.]
MSPDPDVTVVGSGPNGLAAAITAARAGLSVLVLEAADTIGGGLRTAELTLPGFRHDVCSAVHPAVASSPFFRATGIAERIDWVVPEASYAHPFDDGSAAVAWRDLDRTADGLGHDGNAWRRMLGPLVRNLEGLVEFTGSQLLRWPSHPVTAARFARRVLEQGSGLWDSRFRGTRAPALLSGVMAHAAARQPSLAAAGTGLLLAAHAHAGGWPLPRGGAQSLADALVADLEAHGGRIETGQRVRSPRELPRSRATLLATSPRLLLSTDLPSGYRRAIERYRYGTAAAKVDFALDGPVPWSNPDVALAPTVHLGGTRQQLAEAENEVAAGRVPERPFVLVTQPSGFDETRAPKSKAVLWAYIHVPHGSTLDSTELVTAQIERYAPGFRDRVLASHAFSAAELENYNPGYVGGDIFGGAVTLAQFVKRPLVSRTPWRTPLDGVYLCSASTPPGPAVHGVNGWLAARLALRDRFGISID